MNTKLCLPARPGFDKVSKRIEGKERITPEEKTTAEWQYQKSKPNELEIQLRMRLQGERKIHFKRFRNETLAPGILSPVTPITSAAKPL
jgi:hypothetical protein